jgi:hypothetical protein
VKSSKDNLIEEFIRDFEYGMKLTNKDEQLQQWVRRAISDLCAKGKTVGREERENEINPDHLYMEGIKKGAQEERAFILNVLDGIDIADREAGLKQSTKAIRFALQSRSI